MLEDDMIRALECIERGTRARKLENESLDFKEDRSAGRSNAFQEVCALVATSAACLANAHGGHVVLGVADDVPGPDAFTGTLLDPRKLRSRVWQITRPPLAVECHELHHAGVRLLAVRVLGAAVVHQGPDGIVRRRVGDRCEPLDPQSIASLVATKQGLDWSSEPSARSPDDVVEATVESLRERLRRQPRDLSELPRRNLLRKLGLTLADGRLTRAGELMLCEHGNVAAGRALYLFKRSSGSEPSTVERLNAPLPLLLDRLVELVWTRRDTVPVNYSDGTQVSIAGFPQTAVRETLSNALLHADWRYGDPITIEHSPDALVIQSPGSLVDGVRESNLLTTGSTPRNRTLFDAATLLGMSERAGQGIDRMYRDLIRSGQDAPSILDTGNAVRVAMTNRTPRTELIALFGTLPDRLAQSLDVLLALLSLTDRKTIDATELAGIVQKPDTTEAANVLSALAEERASVIEPTRETASHRMPRYRLRADVLRRLGREVAYHRADPTDLDEKVRRHLADYGEINNRTLQSLFDVDVGRARNMLDDLRRRNVVEKLPGPSRGRGVRYGPGSDPA